MKKILFITGHDFGGPNYGGVLRARNLCKLLARFGDVKLVLAGFHEAWRQEDFSDCAGFPVLRKIRFVRTQKISLANRWQHDLNPRFMKTDWIEALPADREWLEKNAPEYDLIWVHHLQIANRFGRWRWPRTVLDIDDIPSEVERSRRVAAKNGLEKMNCSRRILVLRRHENFLSERFDALCVCSEQDKNKISAPEKTFVVLNGFDAPEKIIPRQIANPPRIGFIANLAYEPNRQSLRWFLENVWPRIVEKNPSAKLRVAGEKSDEPGLTFGKNVEPLGWIDSVENEMATWSLSAVPIIRGGGTRLKIAEAFSRHCPVVATTLGAYGYEAENGRDIFLADEASDFAEKCSRILNDAKLGQMLAENAWKKFLKNWTWDAQAKTVEAIVQKISNAPK